MCINQNDVIKMGVDRWKNAFCSYGEVQVASLDGSCVVVSTCKWRSEKSCGLMLLSYGVVYDHVSRPWARLLRLWCLHCSGHVGNGISNAARHATRCATNDVVEKSRACLDGIRRRMSVMVNSGALSTRHVPSPRLCSVY